MNRFFQARPNLVLALCTCACACIAVAACATPGASSLTTATASLPGTRAVSARDADTGIVIGKSTRADVLAALGKTTVVSFDSGFEVWIYRYRGDALAAGTAAKASPGEAEFVVLFNPSGVATKTRIRLAPQFEKRGGNLPATTASPEDAP
jgi:hypothetical protein